MKRFNIEVCWPVNALTLDVAKLIAGHVIDTIKTSTNAAVSAAIVEENGMEHRIATNPGVDSSGKVKWVHREGSELGARGRMVRTVYEDDK